jgi:uncharacterized protein
VHHIDFNRCNPFDWAQRIRCPVLLIHGKNDWRVLPEHSVRLFQAITSRKDLWLVEGAGHTQAFARHLHEYVRRVKEFVDYMKGKEATAAVEPLPNRSCSESDGDSPLEQGR